MNDTNANTDQCGITVVTAQSEKCPYECNDNETIGKGDCSSGIFESIHKMSDWMTGGTTNIGDE